MKRFLIEGELKEGLELVLAPEESKHAARVMRLVAGDEILLADGKGREARAEILDAEKTGMRVRVLSLEASRARPYRLELWQATLKGPRMDWLVEKATELGVDALRPIRSQYSVAEGKLERWQRLAQSALKQSGNLRLPEITEATPLAEAWAQLPAAFTGILLSPSAKQGLAAALAATSAQGNVILAIGPEGGFSPEEENAFLARGFLACGLSSQILRGETAALAALAVASHSLEFPLAPRL